MLRLLQVLLLLQISLSPVRLRHIEKRESASGRSRLFHPSRLDCYSARSSQGDYYYISSGQEADTVCGFYILGLSNQIIEIEFLDFTIDCFTSDGTKRGILSVIDGWELNGQLFPSVQDHLQSLGKRAKYFCGARKPSSIFISGQNVAQIQFVIPQAGQGFRLRIRMPQNPQPCNVISSYEEGLYTIQNYGKAINCSLSVVHPEKIRFLSADVGVARKGIETFADSKCDKRRDYVELRDGDGLDPEFMTKIVSFCGRHTTAAKRGVYLGCGNSVVRLVSSGEFFNSVTFSYTEPTEKERLKFGSCKTPAYEDRR